MVNDTSTISGALQEMIDRLEDNLQAKGVNTTYDSTTGILGLIDQIPNISQSGGGVPCYKVEFTNHSLTYGDWDFTNNRHCANLEIYLQNQYQPCANETVTISDGTNTYTATTDSNGIAKLTPPITENSTTFTVTYNNTSDTITVTKSTFLFKDECSSSAGLSNYGEYVQLYTSTSGNPSCAISYDSTMNAYDIHSTNTTTSYYSMIPITQMAGKTNFIASMEIYQNKSYSSNEIGFYCDNSADDTSYGYGALLCVYYTKVYGRRLIKTGSSSANNYPIEDYTMAVKTWYRLELEITDSLCKYRLYDMNGDLITKGSYTQAISNKQLGLVQKGGSVANTTNYIRNIKIRSIA